jgi:hypothetical protein
MNVIPLKFEKFEIFNKIKLNNGGDYVNAPSPLSR